MAVRPTSWLITTRRISPALTQRRTSRLLHSPELVARGRAISFTKCLILRLPSILRTFLTQAWFTKTSLCLLSKRLRKFLRVTEGTSYVSHSGFLAVIVLNEERFTFNQKYKAKFGETCGLFCKYKSKSSCISSNSSCSALIKNPTIFNIIRWNVGSTE